MTICDSLLEQRTTMLMFLTKQKTSSVYSTFDCAFSVILSLMESKLDMAGYQDRQEAERDHLPKLADVAVEH